MFDLELKVPIAEIQYTDFFFFLITNLRDNVRASSCTGYWQGSTHYS